MVKDDKINLKLEVLKDKNSGQLLLMAHFDQNAPNVFKEKETIFWMPTIEEKDFLNEAFKMIPEEKTLSPSKEPISKPDEPKKNISELEESEEPISKPEELKEIVEELEESKEIISEPGEPKVIISEPEKHKEIKDSSELQSQTEESKPTDISPVTELEESTDYVDTFEDFKTDDIDKNTDDIDKNTDDIDKNVDDIHNKIERDDIPPDIDGPIIEELKAEELKTLEEEKDKAIIVEADADAIDAALKKRTKKDESIIEADEQTIIDKVLSQKKKGRWSSK
jgi:hypothetical protein